MKIELHLTESDAKTLLNQVRDLQFETSGTYLWKLIGDQLKEEIYG